MTTPSSSGSSPISGTRVRGPALPDMFLEQAPGARATAAVCVERPGGRRPFAAATLREGRPLQGVYPATPESRTAGENVAATNDRFLPNLGSCLGYNAVNGRLGEALSLERSALQRESQELAHQVANFVPGASARSLEARERTSTIWRCR
jgi:hypothetical protein